MDDRHPAAPQTEGSEPSGPARTQATPESPETQGFRGIAGGSGVSNSLSHVVVDDSAPSPPPLSLETPGFPAQAVTDKAGPEGLSVAGEKSGPRRMRITVDVDSEVVEEAKDAYWAAHRRGMVDKWAHHVETALRELTERLRAEINEGEAFPHRPQRKTGERFTGGRPLS